MKSESKKMATRAICLVLLGLVVSTVVVTVPRRAMAQTDTSKQDCEGLKKQISELQDLLQQESDALGRLERDAERQATFHQKALDEFKKFAKNFSHISGFEEIRGKLLDDLAVSGEHLRHLRNAIEIAKASIQATKDLISELLNKLGTCGAKTTPTPQPAPTPNPTPAPPKSTGNQVGYRVDTQTANGLFATTFDTPQGKIKVNLTDDVAAGDTISGTVETEPTGKNDAERAQNQAELNGYVVELEGQKTKVEDKKITCNIPPTLTTEAKTIVIQHNGQPVSTTEVPISVTPPPKPSQCTLPTGGQQGRTLECGGNFTPTDYVKIGGTILPEVAGSPRKKVVHNTSEVIGPTTIECSQHGVATQCPFRNIGIKLSAALLNLLRGQKTTLHIVVFGLLGIEEDVPLDLENNSPTVITMSGGDVQHIVIHRAEVRADGTYATDRTLTGIMAGGFGVTATVRWSNVCKRP